MRIKYIIARILLLLIILTVSLLAPKQIHAQTIIDDDAASYSTVWTDFATQGYQNSGVHFPATTSSGQTATWSFSTVTAGAYKIYTGWSTDPNRTTSANYRLNYQGGLIDKVIDQEKLSDQSTVGGSGQWSGWYPIGTYNLDSTSNLVLTSVDNSSGNDYVIADEVLLVPNTAPSQVWVDLSYNQNSENDWHIWNHDAFATIQSAINAVADNGVVHVATGTYNESQIIINKPVEIYGAGYPLSIIDGGSALTLANIGLVRITASGNVTFKGFTIKNAGVNPLITGNSEMPVRVGIYASSTDIGATYSINHNKIIGTNNPSDEEDYGFYSLGGKDSLIFTNNIITQTGSNAILLEKHLGATDVSLNTWDRGVADGRVDPYFNMNYDGADITSLQKVSSNTIDMGTGTVFDNSHRGFAITFASSFTGTAGGFTNIQVKDNVIQNLKDYRRGIGFWNNAPGDGSSGNIQAPIISGNIITGLVGNIGGQGIRLLGLVTDAVINGNVISNVETNFRGQLWNGHISTGSILNNNSFIGNPGKINWDGSLFLDASKNYWGTAVKSTIQAKITGPVTFEPYWVNSAKNILSSTIPSTVFVDDGYSDGVSGGHYFGYDAFAKIQEGIDALASGGTVNVYSGVYNENTTIAKPLSLIGAGNTSSFINGLADLNPVVTIKSKNVTLKNFTIKNEKRTGLGGNSFLLYIYDIDTTSSFANVSILNNIFGPQSAPLGLEGGRHGIYLDGVTRQLLGVTIADNEIKDIKGNGNGIMLWARKEAGGTYANSLLSGITINNNNIHHIRRSGIEAAGEFRNSTISYNYIHDNGFSPESGTPESKYGNGIVLFKDHSELDISVRDNNVIKSNTVSNNTHSGIYLSGGSTNNLIKDNSFDHNKWGVVLDKDPNSIYSPDPNPLKPVDDLISGTLVNQNAVINNSDIGIFSNFTAVINATNNWWGFANGPSGGSIDPITGNVANGAGDKVWSNIHFDPFSTTPQGAFDKRYAKGGNILLVNTGNGKFVFYFAGFASQTSCSGTKAGLKSSGNYLTINDKCSEDPNDKMTASGFVNGTINVVLFDRGGTRLLTTRRFNLKPI